MNPTSIEFLWRALKDATKAYNENGCHGCSQCHGGWLDTQRHEAFQAWREAKRKQIADREETLLEARLNEKIKTLCGTSPPTTRGLVTPKEIPGLDLPLWATLERLEFPEGIFYVIRAKHPKVIVEGRFFPKSTDPVEGLNRAIRRIFQGWAEVRRIQG